MPHAAINDIQMYYEEHGPPDGPPLVLLHNYTGTGATTWVAQTPETFLARQSPEAQASFRARHAAQGPEHWRTVVMSWFALADHAHADDFPEQEALRRIIAPTLLVHGDRDQFFPVEVSLAM